AAGATLHVVPMRRITTSGPAVRWLAYIAGWPVAVVRLTWLARRLRADVIHSNSLHSWYGWAVAALLRRPHVWHAREIVTQSAGALKLERWLARRFATRVIAISAAVAAQLDPGNVVVVYDEPDPATFYPARAGRFRAEVGISDDVPLVGAASRIDTWKGVDVLLDAVPSVQAARPDVQVVIAGSLVQAKEAYAARLAARAAELAGVHWLGPRTDVADLLADLDVFVLPSTQPEPFGLVLVEALASGVPVVATDSGGPVEVLDGVEPEVGRLVPAGNVDALAAAVCDLLGLLTDGRSSTAERQARPVRRRVTAPPFADLFDQVVAEFIPFSARWRRGKGRGVPPRNAPR
ncbi:MAG TPA: glycosyltransferase family 4 protein, partial [Acidimicrobiales bacterium]|nr:glycosyltransferase family 4 protein [Acidimicrobiales bacterium]